MKRGILQFWLPDGRKWSVRKEFNSDAHMNNFIHKMEAEKRWVLDEILPFTPQEELEYMLSSKKYSLRKTDESGLFFLLNLAGTVLAIVDMNKKEIRTQTGYCGANLQGIADFIEYKLKRK